MTDTISDIKIRIHGKLVTCSIRLHSGETKRLTLTVKEYLAKRETLKVGCPPSHEWRNRYTQRT